MIWWILIEFLYCNIMKLISYHIILYIFIHISNWYNRWSRSWLPKSRRGAAALEWHARHPEVGEHNIFGCCCCCCCCCYWHCCCCCCCFCCCCCILSWYSPSPGDRWPAGTPSKISKVKNETFSVKNINLKWIFHSWEEILGLPTKAGQPFQSILTGGI